MSNIKQAQAEKEKGNSAFKSGDWATAVGHYSAAIIHDHEDFTLPLNRAAAYLKLSKYDDADRDCTRVLGLKPDNAKALFRRGQARHATGRLHEADEDLRAAIKIEPATAAITQELSKVTEALKASRAAKGKQPLDISAVVPKRRRVPIKIVDGDEKEAVVKPKSILKTSKTNSMSPSSAPKAVEEVNSSSKEAPASPSKPAPISPKAPAQNVTDFEVKKTLRVGGGIFRANGTQTVFPARDVQPTTPTTPKTPRTTIPHKMPANLFDLNKVWAMCETPEDRYHLISMIPPTQFPAFFQTSLEPSLLVSILQTFLDALDRDASTQQRITAYLDAFASVPRFGTLLLFLNLKEKETARALVGRLGGSHVLNPVWGKML